MSTQKAEETGGYKQMAPKTGEHAKTTRAHGRTHGVEAERKVPGAHGGRNPGEKAPVHKNKAVLDLGGMLSVGNVASVLKAIANEPGEAGELSFKVDAVGKAGSGIVNARLSGWAELTMGYSMNDENYNVLSVDMEGALEAGVDIAGFIHAGVEVGGGRDFLNNWYQGAEDAAGWIIHQLMGLNEVAGGKLFHLEGVEEAPEPGYEVEDREAFAGAEAGVDLGVAKLSGKKQIKKLNRKYIKEEHGKHVEVPSSELHKETFVDFEVDVHGVSVGAHYHRDWSNTVGGPFYYSTGVFDEKSLTVSVGKDDLFTMANKTHEVGKIPTKGVQNLILNVFSGLEKAVGSFKWAKMLNGKLFDKVVKEMYKADTQGTKAVGGMTFNITFDWNAYGESDGKENLMYFRVLVEPERSMKAGTKTPAGGVEAEASSSKSEVVYERLGVETISYIQRQFVYETRDRPWSKFKAENRAQLNKLVQNCATPGFRYYYPEVEAAFKSGKGQNYRAGMAALENVWTKQKQKLDEIAPDAGKIGELLEKGTGFFTMLTPYARNDYMYKIMNILLKYANDPPMLKFLLDQLPNYAVDVEELRKLARETNYETALGNIYMIANRAKKERA